MLVTYNKYQHYQPFSSVWRETLRRLFIDGHERRVVDQFGKPVLTRETLHNRFEFYFPVITDALNLVKNRNANIRFNMAEALFILSGVYISKFFNEINENIKNYAEPDGIFNAAYGGRMFWYRNIPGAAKYNSLRAIIAAHREDEYNRRMFLQICDAYYDMLPAVKDRACNQLVQFIKNPITNRLDMTVTSRSADIVWGMTYDVFNFTVLHEIVATLLNEVRGRFIYNIQSLHIYEPFFDKARAWIVDEELNGAPFISNCHKFTFEQFLTDIDVICDAWEPGTRSPMPDTTLPLKLYNRVWGYQQ